MDHKAELLTLKLKSLELKLINGNFDDNQMEVVYNALILTKIFMTKKTNNTQTGALIKWVHLKVSVMPI